MHGILVIGAPGAGKSTLCAAFEDIFLQMQRDILRINLDPANDSVGYNVDYDIKELICVEDVMSRLGLGPNGALKYCIETLCKNEDWLIEKILNNKSKYVIIDCPGQLELYKSEGELWKIVRSLEKLGVQLCALHLTDSFYCSDPAKFVSVALSTLSVMVTLEMPQVNVLSKVDLFDSTSSYDLDFFTRLPDVSKLVDLLDDIPGLEKYHGLNEVLSQVISDYDLVNFVPLDVRRKESMVNIIKMADNANGFSMTEQGDLRDVIMK